MVRICYIMTGLQVKVILVLLLGQLLQQQQLTLGQQTLSSKPQITTRSINNNNGPANPNGVSATNNGKQFMGQLSRISQANSNSGKKVFHKLKSSDPERQHTHRQLKQRLHQQHSQQQHHQQQQQQQQQQQLQLQQKQQPQQHHSVQSTSGKLNFNSLVAENCSFGTDTYSIGDRWNPVLPPFGVQSCVICTCEAKKTCFEAKVKCKNIKNDCPQSTCANGEAPVIKPGDCCKSCPGDKGPVLPLPEPVSAECQLVNRTRVKNQKDLVRSLSVYGDPLKADQDTSAQRDTNNDNSLQESQVYSSSSVNNKCHYEDRSYEDGAQWKASHKQCNMCWCKSGSVVCDPIQCPELPNRCHNGSAPVLLEGECCRVCPPKKTRAKKPNHPRIQDDTIQQPFGCKLEGDQVFRQPGSKWHPYLPPFGFDKCTVCECHALNTTIHCVRTKCPPLDCPKREAYRENRADCCRRCPPNAKLVVRRDTHQK